MDDVGTTVCRRHPPPPATVCSVQRLVVAATTHSRLDPIRPDRRHHREPKG